MALLIAALLGAAAVPGTAQGGHGAGAERGWCWWGGLCCCGTAPERLPACRSLFSALPHERVTARLCRSGECSAEAGGRSQTSTMLRRTLLPDWVLLFYFFSEVYGLGILALG